MSDCRVPMPTYEPPEREDNVLRGRIVFTDGTDLPLSYYRMGREVERFEMDASGSWTRARPSSCARWCGT